jgi:hypothetical protein
MPVGHPVSMVRDPVGQAIVTSNRTLDISSGSGMLLRVDRSGPVDGGSARGVIAKAGTRHGSRLEIATGLHIESVLLSSVLQANPVDEAPIPVMPSRRD